MYLLMKRLFLIAALLAITTGYASSFTGTAAYNEITWHFSTPDDTTKHKQPLFYPTPDALAATYDAQGKVDSALRAEIFDLYNAHQWTMLEQLFNDNNLNSGWPPANGGYDTHVVHIKKGEVFDRYQSSLDTTQNVKGYPLLTGTFFSPVIDGKSFPYGMRALRSPENTAALYYKVEVLKNLKFDGESATIIPWFNEPGNGLQIDWEIPLSGKYPTSLTQLALDGLIRITIVNSPSGLYSGLAGKTIP